MTQSSFYTMMENLSDVHLGKDVGLIPYVLNKEGLTNSYIVAYDKKEVDFPSLKSTVPGLKIVIRKKYTGNTILDGCIWLIFNSRKIDILNLYHYKPSTFIWIPFYKFFNPKGKVYLKLDIDPTAGMKMKMKKGSFKWILTKRILGKCTLITCETKIFKEYADKNWPIKIEYIPNGILLRDLKIKLDYKEKIIMTVGRLGTKQKATEILLEGFQRASSEISNDWKLILIGSMENDFKEYFKSFLKEHENIASRIIYKGEIKDRQLLNKAYEKCKIFILTSRWEGFPLAGMEAISKGDYLLTTDLYSFKEMNNNGKFGDIFRINNVTELSEKIIKICNDFEEKDLFNTKELENFLLNNYIYEKNCRKIFNLLN